jgi:hypothetical protein
MQVKNVVRPIAKFFPFLVHLLEVMQLDFGDFSGYKAVLKKVEFIGLRSDDQLKLGFIVLIKN